MIGKRLKGARAASGLSLRALSDAMENKVSAQAIGKYERNEDMPGSGVLLSLARALGVSVDFLLSDDELELEGVEFRKSASSSAKEIATIEAKTLNMVEKYLAIESLLNLSSQEWDAPHEAPYWVADVRDAEDAARNMRASWQLVMTRFQCLPNSSRSTGSKCCLWMLIGLTGLRRKCVEKSITPPVLS